MQMKKLYCQYCGQLLDDGCNCARELQEAEEELIEQLEERDLMYAPQQDLIDSYRFER